MKPRTLSNIRAQNLKKLLDLLTLSPGTTRQELAEATGLSLMTVTNLVDLLKEQQVLTLCHAPRSISARRVSGRKAEAITLCGDHKAWLMADLSGSQFRLSLMGFDMCILQEWQDSATGDYLPRLERFLLSAREELPGALDGRTLLGIAIVTPGPYEISSDLVSNQRLPELNGVCIKALFRRCLGDYDYYVDEDVKFAVRAYSETTALDRCEVLYYLYIGEGVGGSAVHSGNMLRGLNATAGDAGQLNGPDGLPYEQRLSLTAFARRMGLDDTLPPEALKRELARIAADSPDVYRDGLCRMAAAAAEMLHGVLWMLDPTHIVIDCRYAGPFAGDFIGEVKTRLQQRFPADQRVLPCISSPPLNVSSILRGAVSVLQREWLERILS